jgi:hypothetical protein
MGSKNCHFFSSIIVSTNNVIVVDSFYLVFRTRGEKRRDTQHNPPKAIEVERGRQTDRQVNNDQPRCIPLSTSANSSEHDEQKRKRESKREPDGDFIN